MQTDELIYNVTGQVVETYPPEWPDGVPSSATCSVYDGTDSNDDTAAFSPTVTVDSVSTTVDAASGFSQTDKRKVSLTATTSVNVGYRYLLENAAGQRELVKVTAITSGDHVLVQEPLKYDYTTADTFKGLRMSWTVDATWVADEDNVLAHGDVPYRAVWAYTVNSLSRRHYTYLRLVRQPFKTGVTVYDLAEHLPDVDLSEPDSQRGQQLQQAINAAVDRVRVDLISSGITPDMIRDTEVVDELVRTKAIQISSNWHTPAGLDKESWSIATREDYEKLYARITSGTLKVPVDTGAEGSVTSTTYSRLWFER